MCRELLDCVRDDPNFLKTVVTENKSVRRPGVKTPKLRVGTLSHRLVSEKARTRESKVKSVSILFFFFLPLQRSGSRCVFTAWSNRDSAWKTAKTCRPRPPNNRRRFTDVSCAQSQPSFAVVGYQAKHRVSTFPVSTPMCRRPRLLSRPPAQDGL